MHRHRYTSKQINQFTGDGGNARSLDPSTFKSNNTDGNAVNAKPIKKDVNLRPKNVILSAVD